MAVSAANYAARLRLIRRMAGMLYHPQMSEVVSDEEFGKIDDAIYTLRKSTPLTPDEYLAFAIEGAKDLEVVWSEEKQRKVFAFKESRAQ